MLVFNTLELKNLLDVIEYAEMQARDSHIHICDNAHVDEEQSVLAALQHQVADELEMSIISDVNVAVKRLAEELLENVYKYKYTNFAQLIADAAARVAYMDDTNYSADKQLEALHAILSISEEE